jgi:hypothetical protein
LPLPLPLLLPPPLPLPLSLLLVVPLVLVQQLQQLLLPSLVCFLHSQQLWEFLAVC